MREVWSASSNGTICIWHAQLFRCEGQLHLPSAAHTLIQAGHRSDVWCGCTDAQIRVFKAEKRVLAAELTGHTGAVRALLVVPRAIAPSASSPAELLPSPLQLDETLDGADLDASFLPPFAFDGADMDARRNWVIWSGGDDHSIRVWRIKDRSCLAVIRAHLGAVHHLACATQPAPLAPLSPARSPVPAAPAHSPPPPRDPAGRVIVWSAADDTTVRVWDARTCEVLHHAEREGLVGVPEALCPAGNEVWAAWRQHSRITAWDASTGRVHRELRGPTAARALASARGHVWSGGADGSLRKWNVKTAQVSRVVRASKWRACCIAVVGATVWAGSDDGSLRIWNAVTGALLHDLPAHDAAVLAVAHAPDLEHPVVWTAAADGSVRLWDALAATPLPFRAPDTRALGLTGAPTQLLAVGAQMWSTWAFVNRIVVWDAATGHFLRELSGHAGAVTCLAAASTDAREMDGLLKLPHAHASDGGQQAHLVWSGALDGSLRVWDPAMGLSLAELSLARSPASSPALPSLHAPRSTHATAMAFCPALRREGASALLPPTVHIGCADGAVRVYDGRTALLLETLMPPCADDRDAPHCSPLFDAPGACEVLSVLPVYLGGSAVSESPRLPDVVAVPRGGPDPLQALRVWVTARDGTVRIWSPRAHKDKGSARSDSEPGSYAAPFRFSLRRDARLPAVAALDQLVLAAVPPCAEPGQARGTGALVWAVSVDGSAALFYAGGDLPVAPDAPDSPEAARLLRAGAFSPPHPHPHLSASTSAVAQQGEATEGSEGEDEGRESERELPWWCPRARRLEGQMLRRLDGHAWVARIAHSAEGDAPVWAEARQAVVTVHEHHPALEARMINVPLERRAHRLRTQLTAAQHDAAENRARLASLQALLARALDVDAPAPAPAPASGEGPESTEPSFHAATAEALGRLQERAQAAESEAERAREELEEIRDASSGAQEFAASMRMELQGARDRVAELEASAATEFQARARLEKEKLLLDLQIAELRASYEDEAAKLRQRLTAAQQGRDHRDMEHRGQQEQRARIERSLQAEKEQRAKWEARARDAEKSLAALEREATELRDTSAARRSELEESLQARAVAEENCAAMSDQLARERTHIEELTRERDSLDTERRKANQYASQLSAIHQDQTAHLQSCIKELTGQKTDTEHQLAQVRRVHAQSAAVLEQERITLQATQQQFDALAREMERLRGDEARRGIARAALEKRLLRLRSLPADGTLPSAYEEELLQLAEECASLRSKGEALQTDLDEARAKTPDPAPCAKCPALQARIADLEAAQAHSHGGKAGDLEAREARLAETRALEARLADETQKRGAREARLVEQTQALEAREARLAEQTQALEAREARLAEEAREREAHTASLYERVQQADRELRAERTRATALEVQAQQASHYERELATLRQQIDQCRDDTRGAEAVREELRALRGDNADLRERLQRASHDLREMPNLRAEAEGLRNRAGQQACDLALLRGETESLQDALHDARIRLSAELDARKQERKSLKGEVARLKDQLLAVLRPGAAPGAVPLQATGALLSPPASPPVPHPRSHVPSPSPPDTIVYSAAPSVGIPPTATPAPAPATTAVQAPLDYPPPPPPPPPLTLPEPLAPEHTAAQAPGQAPLGTANAPVPAVPETARPVGTEPPPRAQALDSVEAHPPISAAPPAHVRPTTEAPPALHARPTTEAPPALHVRPTTEAHVRPVPLRPELVEPSAAVSPPETAQAPLSQPPPPLACPSGASELPRPGRAERPTTPPTHDAAAAPVGDDSPARVHLQLAGMVPSQAEVAVHTAAQPHPPQATATLRMGSAHEPISLDAPPPPPHSHATAAPGSHPHTPTHAHAHAHAHSAPQTALGALSPPQQAVPPLPLGFLSAPLPHGPPHAPPAQWGALQHPQHSQQHQPSPPSQYPHSHAQLQQPSPAYPHPHAVRAGASPSAPLRPRQPHTAHAPTALPPPATLPPDFMAGPQAPTHAPAPAPALLHQPAPAAAWSPAPAPAPLPAGGQPGASMPHYAYSPYPMGGAYPPYATPAGPTHSVSPTASILSGLPTDLPHSFYKDASTEADDVPLERMLTEITEGFENEVLALRSEIAAAQGQSPAALPSS